MPRARRRLSGRQARELTFAALILLYALLTIGVLVYPSPVLSLDQWWLDRHLWGAHRQYHWFVYHYVMLGQRGPTTIVFLPVVAYLAWRRRTSAPVVMFVTSLLLLNLSVAVVKYFVGRVGPRDQDDVHVVFTSGTLFPSGHLSNTVVVYGVLAMLIPRFRRLIITAVVVLCLSIGLGTIYLRTHWLSDVVGGWIAGALVLLALPDLMPHVQPRVDAAVAAAQARWGHKWARWSKHQIGPADPPNQPEPSAQEKATPVS